MRDMQVQRELAGEVAEPLPQKKNNCEAIEGEKKQDSTIPGRS